MTLTIYKPEGVHNKDNPCNCGYCAKFPEFFHAIPYKVFHFTYTGDIKDAIIYRDKNYPDGVICLDEITSTGQYYIREDGSKVTYNKTYDVWVEEDGTLLAKYLVD